MAKRGGWWSEKQTLQFFKDFRQKMADEAAKNAKQQNAADKKKFAAIPAELKALEAKHAAKKAARAAKMQKMRERAIAAAQASSEAN